MLLKKKKHPAINNMYIFYIGKTPFLYSFLSILNTKYFQKKIRFRKFLNFCFFLILKNILKTEVLP